MRGIGDGAAVGSAAINLLIYFGLISVSSEGGPYGVAVAVVATAVDIIVTAVLDFFGGGSHGDGPPRQLLHHLHPIYPYILGIRAGPAMAEGSSASEPGI